MPADTTGMIGSITIDGSINAVDPNDPDPADDPNIDTGQITDVTVFPPSSCGKTTAVALRVYPPGATRSLEIPLTFQACGKSGPVYLHVGPTEGGPGLPGFSR